jgi:hypothetical protein
MCFVESFPEGRADRVRWGITPGKESRDVASTNRSAFATDEWNVMKLTQVAFRHRLGQADLCGHPSHIPSSSVERTADQLSQDITDDVEALILCK